MQHSLPAVADVLEVELDQSHHGPGLPYENYGSINPEIVRGDRSGHSG